MNTWTRRADRMVTIYVGTYVYFHEGRRIMFGKVTADRHDKWEILCSDAARRRILKERVTAVDLSARRS